MAARATRWSASTSMGCAVLDALPPTIGKILYVSSTGVYGQIDGEEIDESSPTEPRREGGRVCLAAERALQAHPLGRNGVILRLAGIYGPGRVPNRADLVAGKPLPFDPAGHLNLIHVDDAAEAILAAERGATTPNLFVVSDGSPAARGDYYAELRGCGTPPRRASHRRRTTRRLRRRRLRRAVTVLMRRCRGGADKRISPAKLIRDLDMRFRFADFRAGLADIARRDVSS
ncbi:MAG: NAD-dependent epimerase/dehydratase family protein [Pirellulales bacterium]